MAQAKRRVLFLSAANGTRSQMAEAYAKKILGDDYEVTSAGREASTLNPYAVQVMREDGIDITKQKSKDLGKVGKEKFDTVITLCTEDVCLEENKGPSCEDIHWDVSNPCISRDSISEVKKISEFRKVRDEIKKQVVDLKKKDAA